MFFLLNSGDKKVGDNYDKKRNFSIYYNYIPIHSNTFITIKIKKASEIRQDLELKKPRNGSAKKITSTSNWHGFIVDVTTELKVLEAEVEKTTTNMIQKLSPIFA